MRSIHATAGAADAAGWRRKASSVQCVRCQPAPPQSRACSLATRPSPRLRMRSSRCPAAASRAQGSDRARHPATEAKEQRGACESHVRQRHAQGELELRAAAMLQKRAFNFPAALGCILANHQQPRIGIRVELPPAPAGARRKLHLLVRRGVGSHIGRPARPARSFSIRPTHQRPAVASEAADRSPPERALAVRCDRPPEAREVPAASTLALTAPVRRHTSSNAVSHSLNAARVPVPVAPCPGAEETGSVRTKQVLGLDRQIREPPPRQVRASPQSFRFPRSRAARAPAPVPRSAPAVPRWSGSPIPGARTSSSQEPPAPSTRFCPPLGARDGTRPGRLVRLDRWPPPQVRPRAATRPPRPQELFSCQGYTPAWRRRTKWITGVVSHFANSASAHNLEVCSNAVLHLPTERCRTVSNPLGRSTLRSSAWFPSRPASWSSRGEDFRAPLNPSATAWCFSCWPAPLRITGNWFIHGERMFPGHMPLELCDFALWLVIATLLTLKPAIFDVAYYWAAIGATAAVLTPQPHLPLALPGDPVLRRSRPHRGGRPLPRLERAIEVRVRGRWSDRCWH